MHVPHDMHNACLHRRGVTLDDSEPAGEVLYDKDDASATVVDFGAFDLNLMVLPRG